MSQAWHLLWHLWDLIEFKDPWKKRFSIHNPRTTSGLVRECPTWDIILRSPFESMEDISKLPWKLQMRTSVRRKRRMDYGIWNTLARTDPNTDKLTYLYMHWHIHTSLYHLPQLFQLGLSPRVDLISVWWERLSSAGAPKLARKPLEWISSPSRRSRGGSAQAMPQWQHIYESPSMWRWTRPLDQSWSYYLWDEGLLMFGIRTSRRPDTVNLRGWTQASVHGNPGFDSRRLNLQISS